MAYPFKCEGCGKPRNYINQYCPNCESTGPHIPVSLPDRKRQFKLKFTPERRPEPEKHRPAKKEDVFISEEVDIEIRPRRARKSEEREITDDDRDIRSLYARKPVRRPVNKTAVRNIAVVLAGVACLVIIAANAGSMARAIESANLPGKLAALARSSPSDNKTVKNPPSVTVTDNQSTAKKPDDIKPPATPPEVNKNKPLVAADNASVANTKPPPSNPQPDSDKLRFTDGPAASASSFSATVGWKTNIKSTSFLRYGNDTTYPFPSIEIIELKTDHSILLQGLAPDSLYHYQTISKDSSGNTLTSSDNTFRTEPVSNAAPYMGSRAPDFTLKDLDGTQVTLSQYMGKKVVLNFWASWCTPCKIELPHLQALWDKYRDSPNVMVLTIAGSQSDEAAIRDYVQMENKFDFEVCLDPSDAVFNRYEIVSIPKTYFIDKGGVIRRIQQGMFTSPAEVEFMLESY